MIKMKDVKRILGMKFHTDERMTNQYLLKSVLPIKMKMKTG